MKKLYLQSSVNHYQLSIYLFTTTPDAYHSNNVSFYVFFFNVSLHLPGPGGEYKIKIWCTLICMVVTDRGQCRGIARIFQKEEGYTAPHIDPYFLPLKVTLWLS